MTTTYPPSDRYPDTKIQVDYSHKPEKIESITDLIKFFEGIPDEVWHTGSRMQKGTRKKCAMAHYGQAYRGDPFQVMHPNSDHVIVFLESGIVCANDNSSAYRGMYTNEETPKARVLTYLRSLLPTTTPQPSVALAVITGASPL